MSDLDVAFGGDPFEEGTSCLPHSLPQSELRRKNTVTFSMENSTFQNSMINKQWLNCFLSKKRMTQALRSDVSCDGVVIATLGGAIQYSVELVRSLLQPSALKCVLQRNFALDQGAHNYLLLLARQKHFLNYFIADVFSGCAFHGNFQIPIILEGGQKANGSSAWDHGPIVVTQGSNPQPFRILHQFVKQPKSPVAAVLRRRFLRLNLTNSDNSEIIKPVLIKVLAV